jgi:hypothetical protein
LTPPTPPSAAQRHTVGGAIAFAAFWFRSLNWAYEHVSGAAIFKYSSSKCSDCLLLARAIERVRSRGLRYFGGHVFVRKESLAPNDGRNNAERAVDVTVGQSVLRVLRGNRLVHRGAATRSITFRLWLAWNGSGWTVVQKGHVT